MSVPEISIGHWQLTAGSRCCQKFMKQNRWFSCMKCSTHCMELIYYIWAALIILIMRINSDIHMSRWDTV